MTAKHNLSIVQFDHEFEKSVSNRPRYQPESSKKISMADKSMRSTFSRKDLVSAKGGRRVWMMFRGMWEFEGTPRAKCVAPTQILNMR